MALDFKKLKGLFIEETEEQPSSRSTKTENTPTVTVDSSKTYSPVNTPGGTGIIDAKILDSLLKALETKNLPGEDYLEFAYALKAMTNIPLEENVKFQTVIATLSTKGLTTQKIVESADYYSKVLLEEKNKFYSALEAQIEEQVKNKSSEVSDTENLIKLKTEQIAKLTQEITEHQQEILKVKNQINEADLKIKATESNFLFTFNTVLNQINYNIEKVKSLNLK